MGRGAQQIHITAAHPADHPLRPGQIEGGAPARDRGERGEPEAIGVLVNRGCQLSLDLAPGILKILANVANLPRNLVLLSVGGV
jgi:hypothetical protein